MIKTNRSITYGDRIFARVTKNGKTVLNYVTEKVSTMTELIMELRKKMKDMKGLVMIHIRNYHQGWGEERPLMLYASSFSQTPGSMLKAHQESLKQRENRMLFPWEVH